jgi:hypothetical protein
VVTEIPKDLQPFRTVELFRSEEDGVKKLATVTRSAGVIEETGEEYDFTLVQLCVEFPLPNGRIWNQLMSVSRQVWEDVPMRSVLWDQLLDIARVKNRLKADWPNVNSGK